MVKRMTQSEYNIMLDNAIKLANERKAAFERGETIDDRLLFVSGERGRKPGTRRPRGIVWDSEEGKNIEDNLTGDIRTWITENHKKGLKSRIVHGDEGVILEGAQDTPTETKYSMFELEPEHRGVDYKSETIFIPLVQEIEGISEEEAKARVTRIPANWANQGYKEGPIRNNIMGRMLIPGFDTAGYANTGPLTESKGTSGAMQNAEGLGNPIYNLGKGNLSKKIIYTGDYNPKNEKYSRKKISETKRVVFNPGTLTGKGRAKLNEASETLKFLKHEFNILKGNKDITLLSDWNLTQEKTDANPDVEYIYTSNDEEKGTGGQTEIRYKKGTKESAPNVSGIREDNTIKTHTDFKKMLAKVLGKKDSDEHKNHVEPEIEINPRASPHLEAKAFAGVVDRPPVESAQGPSFLDLIEDERTPLKLDSETIPDKTLSKKETQEYMKELKSKRKSFLEDTDEDVDDQPKTKINLELQGSQPFYDIFKDAPSIDPASISEEIPLADILGAEKAGIDPANLPGRPLKKVIESIDESRKLGDKGASFGFQHYSGRYITAEPSLLDEEGRLILAKPAQKRQNIITDLSTVWDSTKLPDGRQKGFILNDEKDFNLIRGSFYERVPPQRPLEPDEDYKRRIMPRGSWYDEATGKGAEGETELVPVLQAIQETYFPIPPKLDKLGNIKSPYYTSEGLEKDPPRKVQMTNELLRIITTMGTLKHLNPEEIAAGDVIYTGAEGDQVDLKDTDIWKRTTSGEIMYDEKGHPILDYTKVQGMGSADIAPLIGRNDKGKLVGGVTQAKPLEYEAEASYIPHGYDEEPKWLSRKEIEADKNKFGSSQIKELLDSGRKKYEKKIITDPITGEETIEEGLFLGGKEGEFGKFYGQIKTPDGPVGVGYRKVVDEDGNIKWYQYNIETGEDFRKDALDKKFAGGYTITEKGQEVGIRKSGAQIIEDFSKPVKKNIKTFLLEEIEKVNTLPDGSPGISRKDALAIINRFSNEELLQEFPQGMVIKDKGDRTVVGIRRDDFALAQEFDMRDPRGIQARAAAQILEQIPYEKSLTPFEKSLLIKGFTNIRNGVGAKDNWYANDSTEEWNEMLGGRTFRKWFVEDILAKGTNDKGVPIHAKLSREDYNNFGRYNLRNGQIIPMTDDEEEKIQAKKLNSLIVKKTAEQIFASDDYTDLDKPQRIKNLTKILGEQQVEEMDPSQLNKALEEQRKKALETKPKPSDPKDHKLEKYQVGIKHSTQDKMNALIAKPTKNITDKELKTLKDFYETQPGQYGLVREVRKKIDSVKSWKLQEFEEGDKKHSEYLDWKLKKTTINGMDKPVMESFDTANFKEAMKNGSLLDELKNIMGQDVTPEWTTTVQGLHQEGEGISKDSRDIMDQIEARREFDIHDYAKEYEIPAIEEKR